MIGLVALGLFNSVVSAFYYVRILKAMFLRDTDRKPLAWMGPEISLPLLVGAGLALYFGLRPASLLEDMEVVSRSGLRFAARPVARDERSVIGTTLPARLPVPAEASPQPAENTSK